MQGSLHYVTLKQSGYNECNTAVTFYHDRTHFNSQNENPYAKYTDAFNAAQGRGFILHNRKAAVPSKMTIIKEKVREFDELLSNSVITASNDGANAPIVKIIWITSSLLLLVIQDGNLVWIVVDPISNDLLQILVDKSLTQVNPSKLSGSIICDALFYLNPSSDKKIDSNELTSKIILAYLDKSRLDIIGIPKSANFINYLYNPEIKLEKLSSFDPTISFMDFSCPTSYRIAKHLCYPSSNEKGFQSFALYWPNDGQIVWTPSSALSSLEKDDLSTNVIVVSNNKNEHDSLIQNLFKSTGLLLKLNYLNETNLIAIEQSESTTQQFVINIYRYELINEIVSRPVIYSAQHSFKNMIFMFNLSSKIKFVSNLSSCKRYLIMISSDLTVFLCDLTRKIAHKYSLAADKFSSVNLKAEWILGDFLFCIYDINSKIAFYDISFNEIELTFSNRDHDIIKNINDNLNQNVFDLKNNNFFSHLTSFNDIFLDVLNISFVFQKGPFGVLQLKLPNNFNELSLISTYLKANISDNVQYAKNILKSVNLLNMLDWDTQGDVCILCFNKILNFLLSEEIQFTLQTQMFIEQTLGSFYTPQRPLNERTIEDYKYIVTRYARRFFYQLLRYENFDKAFLLAVDIGAKDLFNDLYYCAFDKQEIQLAEICRKKFKEMAAEELQQYYKTQSKVNNISQNFSESDLDIFGSGEEYDSSEEPFSDNSYSSSLNDEIQVSSAKINKHIDKVFNEKQIKSVNQELIKQNEGFIKTNKNSTITINNFNF
jgi:WD repeat-containing and planar cell polarity effector protein